MKNQVTYSEHPSRAAKQAHAKGEKQFRTYDTSYIRPKKRIVAPVVFALVLCGIALAAALYFIPPLLPDISVESSLAAPGEDVAIVISEGSSVGDMARILKNARLIENLDDFTTAVKEQGEESALKPGAYTIAGGTSIDGIIQVLKTGPVLPTFTVPEGLTIARTAQVVEEAYDGAIAADAFVAAAHNATAFEADFPFVSGSYDNSLEGFLYPKTYEKSEGDTAESVIRKMLAQYQQEVAALDYGYAENRGLSPYDVLKMASVVEREAAEDNRATVASVFYNRLAWGMLLQSDATVAYIIDGDPTPDDLYIDNPYNTYVYYGLPAGPICSPGIDTLKAAAAPEETPYLYFYFTENEDGRMNYSFSETYEEHQEAIGVEDQG